MEKKLRDLEKKSKYLRDLDAHCNSLVDQQADLSPKEKATLQTSCKVEGLAHYEVAKKSCEIDHQSDLVFKDWRQNRCETSRLSQQCHNLTGFVQQKAEAIRRQRPAPQQAPNPPQTLQNLVEFALQGVSPAIRRQLGLTSLSELPKQTVPQGNCPALGSQSSEKPMRQSDSYMASLGKTGGEETVPPEGKLGHPLPTLMSTAPVSSPPFKFQMAKKRERKEEEQMESTPFNTSFDAPNGAPSGKYGYWTWDNFVNELVGFINKYYNYLPSTTPEKEMQTQVLEALKIGALALPTTAAMLNYGRGDIKEAIRKFGGLKEVIRKLGIPYTPSQKEKGYWQDWDTFLTELLRFINLLANYLPTNASNDELRADLIPALQAGTIAFPTTNDFEGNNRGDLLQAFKHFGGITGVMSKLQLQPRTKYTPPTKPSGYWKDWDNFIDALVIFINQLYNFLPSTTTQKEIRDKILEALKEGKLDFPDTTVLDKYKKHNLRTAMRYWGGIFKVKEKLGIKASRKPRDYWSNWDNFLKDLLDYILKLNHVDPQLNLTQNEILAQLKAGKLQFPSKNDIEGLSTSSAGQFSSLNIGFQNFGGINVVREKLGIPPPSAKARGFWEDWDNMVNAVTLFINEFYQYLPPSTPETEIRAEILEALRNKIIAFPGKNKFEEAGAGNLMHAIERHHKGLENFKAKLKIPVFYLDDPFSRASKMRYYAIRGQRTEDIVVDLIKDWTDLNHFSYTTQTPIGTGILEFVCGENKKYGIDVTNAKNLDTIRVKWLKRDYHKFLDELWIIVVADHPPKIIKSLNEEAPDNILVIDYRELVPFLNGLGTQNVPFSIPPEKQRKLDALAKCTFNNREQIKRQFKEKEEKLLRK